MKNITTAMIQMIIKGIIIPIAIFHPPIKTKKLNLNVKLILLYSLFLCYL